MLDKCKNCIKEEICGWAKFNIGDKFTCEQFSGYCKNCRYCKRVSLKIGDRVYPQYFCMLEEKMREENFFCKNFGETKDE